MNRRLAIFTHSFIVKQAMLHFSIHPRFKDDVAKRLVLAGRAVAYKEKDLDYQGPFPTAFGVNSPHKLLTVEFSGGHMPIEVRNNDGFEVNCSFIYSMTTAGVSVIMCTHQYPIFSTSQFV